MQVHFPLSYSGCTDLIPVPNPDQITDFEHSASPLLPPSLPHTLAQSAMTVNFTYFPLSLRTRQFHLI